VTSAGQHPNPTLSVQSINISPNQGIAAGGPADQVIDSTLNLSRPFERGNKAKWRVASAQKQLNAAKNDLIDTRR